MPFELTEVERPIGLNSDLNPYDVPPNVWNISTNIDNSRFRNNKARGATARYVGNTLPINPLFTLSWNDGSTPTWIICGKTAIYKVNTTDTYADITNGLTLTADFLEGWTGSVFNGVGILNNTFEEPLYTASTLTVDKLSNAGKTSDWPSTYRCKVIRPYKNRLIALNVNRGSGFEPSTVLWSGPADVGQVPDSWDINEPASGAGDNVLADTDGEIVDGLTLGNSFIVYKQDAVYAMEFVGGTFVYNFRKLFGDEEGMLSRDCVVEFEGKHFVVGKGDAYIHDGISKKSAMSSRVRDKFYGRLDDVFGLRAKLAVDHANKNIWLYYVIEGEYESATTPYPESDIALVYNWESDAWSERTLQNVAHIGVGLIIDNTVDTWELDTQAWDDDTSLWDEGVNVNERPGLLVSDYSNSQLLELESGTTWDGTSIVATLEKKGLDFDDQTTWKKINAIYPKFVGEGTVDISIGHENPPGSGVVWEGPYSFVIGTDYKVDCRVHGRNLSLRIKSTDDNQWSLSSLGVEWKPTKGRR